MVRTLVQPGFVDVPQFHSEIMKYLRQKDEVREGYSSGLLSDARHIYWPHRMVTTAAIEQIHCLLNNNVTSPGNNSLYLITILIFSSRMQFN